MCDIIVIGGGPAGLLAAAKASEKGAKVLLLEKMRETGRKLRLTGKGRCNITNNKSIEEFITYIHPNGRFLRTALHHFFSSDILNLLNTAGIETALSRGGRYFPIDNDATGIRNVVLAYAQKMGVEVRTGMRVTEILQKNGAVHGVKTETGQFTAKKVILTGGGKSYPATGSNGDAHKLAMQLGHSVSATWPALVPLESTDPIIKHLNGLKLKNINGTAWSNGKKINGAFGELRFMSFGLSGPIILTLSREIVQRIRCNEKVLFSIDLKPALNAAQIETRLLRELNTNGKQSMSRILKGWLPHALILPFLEKIDVPPLTVANQLPSEKRKQLQKLLKNWELPISGYRPFKEAIITAGGVLTKEIMPKTMESKRIKNLYFAGEILDLDGKTGGFNLQIAWSTGALAGVSAAQAL